MLRQPSASSTAPPSVTARSTLLKPVLSGHAPIGEAVGEGADEGPGTTEHHRQVFSPTARFVLSYKKWGANLRLALFFGIIIHYNNVSPPEAKNSPTDRSCNGRCLQPLLFDLGCDIMNAKHSSVFYILPHEAQSQQGFYGLALAGYPPRRWAANTEEGYIPELSLTLGQTAPEGAF